MYIIKINKKEYELNTSSYVLIQYKKMYGVDLIQRASEIKKDFDFDFLTSIILAGIKTQFIVKGIKEFDEIKYLTTWEVRDLLNKDVDRQLNEYLNKLLPLNNKELGAPNSKK